ncbi:MAG: group III truncated hemoglobin [Chromatocurvus sp.]
MKPAEKLDLDSRCNIEAFVDAFYAQLLKDERLAPIFLDVAAIDLDQHLPHIKDYWCKLLLGERAYQRHTMNIHRDLHAKRPLNASDFERWLAHFHATVDAGFSGPNADRAKGLATSIAANMQATLRP